MTVEAGSVSNPDTPIDILAQGAIEEMVRAGRPPFSLGAFAAEPDGTSAAVYFAYIPPVGYTREDEVRKFDNMEIMFTAPNGVVRGFAQRQRIIQEHAILIDSRVHELESQANPSSPH